MPCKGAKFILQKLKGRYNFELESIYLNAANKAEVYEKYNLDNSKIPSIFIEERLITYGKVEESKVKEELERYSV